MGKENGREVVSFLTLDKCLGDLLYYMKYIILLMQKFLLSPKAAKERKGDMKYKIYSKEQMKKEKPSMYWAKDSNYAMVSLYNGKPDRVVCTFKDLYEFENFVIFAALPGYLDANGNCE